MMVASTEDDALLTTEDVLPSLCNSVTGLLRAATRSQVRFSGMGLAREDLAISHTSR